MHILALVTVLIIIQYFVFALLVGKARGTHGVKAPAVTGHEVFDRIFRVHQNTQEQLVMLLPTIWLFGYFVNYKVASVFGIIYLIGRTIYHSAYVKDPRSRSLGFSLSILPSLLMLLGLLFVLLKKIFIG